jgi:hypothetical protein
MTSAPEFLEGLLAKRLEGPQAKWLAGAAAEIVGGASAARFASLISLASRYSPRGPLEPTEEERGRAAEILVGWNIERWTMLETVRIALVLAHPEIAGDGGQVAIEEVFRFADDGEACALYRSLAHVPDPERFAWRAGEGCRTNIVPVFEAVACDTPYAVQHFDDVAWNQLVIKTIFIGAPLHRVYGLDSRLSSELARMALDLVEERRSAGRDIQHELWLCLGNVSGERGIRALEQELASSNTIGRRAAAIGLARAGEEPRLRALLETESDPTVAETMRQALAGRTSQAAFGELG